jgi:hypothetical protein
MIGRMPTFVARFCSFFDVDGLTKLMIVLMRQFGLTEWHPPRVAQSTGKINV